MFFRCEILDMRCKNREARIETLGPREKNRDMVPRGFISVDRKLPSFSDQLFLF